MCVYLSVCLPVFLSLGDVRIMGRKASNED